MKRQNVLLVAAADASDADKARADLVCDGDDDEVEIKAAVDLAAEYAERATAPVRFSDEDQDRIAALLGRGPDYCPDRLDRSHCDHWREGKACCSCGDPADAARRIAPC